MSVALRTHTYPLTIGSLFSGVGGLERGVERAGFGPTIWQVEINPFARAVLARHWPKAKQHDDVCTVGRSNLDCVDLICGGFPCQDVSSAGLGAGLAGARSGLWREFRRILEEFRPTFAIVENVASGARRWLPFVRRDLHLLGYRTRALALSAADVGAPHLRRRVFVLAADPERVELRDEPGWRGRPNGQSARVARDDGSERSTATMGDALLDGRSRPEGEGYERGPEPSARGWWTSEPHVGRVADGVSGGVDGRRRRARLRALGNAVIPSCAETAATYLRAMTVVRTVLSNGTSLSGKDNG